MPLPVTPLPPFPGPGNGRAEWEQLAIAYFSALPQFAHEVNAALATVPPQPGALPESVTMLNARLVLIDQGLLESANAYIAAMPGAEGDAARTYWEFAANVRRDNPLVESLRVVLGKTQEEIDALFIAAAALG